jgi:lipid-A-disaccharide synthase
VPDVLIVAGEPSGEEHALTFLPRLLELRPELRLWGVGGDRLAGLGMELRHHLKDFSSMGFSEVVAKIPFYKRALDGLVAEAAQRGTRDAILIDFQDFNLRLARRLKKRGVRVWYYVAPQAWAWKEWRAGVLGQTVERLFTILPFEEAWFRARGAANVTPVPHPLTRQYAAELARLPARPWHAGLETSPRVLLLPGSRHSEVAPLLPLFLETVRELRRRCPRAHVTIARVPHLDPRLYEWADGEVDEWITPAELPAALLRSDVALAASGTATLGTGLLGVPTVVAYQSSLLNAFIFHNFVRYHGHISLTNLILGRKVFPEYVMGQAQVALLLAPMLKWLGDAHAWNEAHAQLARLPGLLNAGEQDVGALLAKGIT